MSFDSLFSISLSLSLSFSFDFCEVNQGNVEGESHGDEPFEAPESTGNESLAMNNRPSSFDIRWDKCQLGEGRRRGRR